MGAGTIAFALCLLVVGQAAPLREEVMALELDASLAPPQVPDDVFAFIRPPVATPTQPSLVSKTDSSFVVSWTFNASSPLTKALEVTNVTTARGLAELTSGTAVQGVGLNNSNPANFALHPVFETYKTRNVSLTLPWYDAIPEGKARVFLRRPVKRFELEVQPVQDGVDVENVDSDGWEVAASVASTDKQCEATNLHPNTAYHVRVCSANSEGKGACGPAQTIKTADVPSQPPPPSIVHVSTQSLELEIVKPENTNGAPLTDMVLEMARKHSGPWSALDYNMAVRKKVVADLEPGALYFFRVTAWNRIGPSASSEPVSFETKSMPPKRVKGFKIVEQEADVKAATTSVTVAWDAPNPRGRPINEYELQKAFGHGTDEADFLLETLTEQRNHTVAGLLAGKMYHLRVRAINDIGSGNWSDLIEIIAAPAVTTQPGPITVTEALARSLSVEWGRPQDFRGAPPMHYVLQMQTHHNALPSGNKPTGMEFWNDMYRGMELSTTLTQLTPATSYSLRVMAVNIAGHSQFSDVVRTATQITEPDAPEPKAITVTTTSITVAWVPPNANGAPITSYRVNIAPTALHDRYLREKANATTAGNDTLGQVLLGQSASIVHRGEKDDEDDINEDLPPVKGRGRKDRKPCDAINPRVYDSDVPARFSDPLVVPGSQPVYPVDGANHHALPTNTTAPPKPANITAPSKPTKPKEYEWGKDGFVTVYEGSDTTVVVDSLKPGETYSISVQATSEVGTSPASELLQVTTTPTVPRRPNAPLQEGRGHNYLAVTWPAADPQGSPVLGYVVQISEGKDRYGKDIFANTCLQEWPPEHGGAEILANFTTRRDVRLEKGLQIGQEMLDKEGVPMDYCKQHERTDAKGEWLSCCVDGLEREKAYKMRVAAISALGMSPFGPSADLVTRGDVPGVPPEPRALEASPTSLVVTWRPPPSGTASHSLTYSLQMTATRGGEPEQVFEGTNHTAVVSSLHPATTYWFRVQAANHNGKSLWSEFGEVRTCNEDEACNGTVEPELEMAPANSNGEEEDARMQAQLAMDAKLRKVASRMHKAHVQHKRHK